MKPPDNSRPPEGLVKRIEMPDYERKWNMALGKLLAYVPYELANELREAGEEWVKQRVIAMNTLDGDQTLAAIEQKIITNAFLKGRRGQELAEQLDIGRTTLYRKLREYGLM